jgi:hypothetical protein
VNVKLAFKTCTALAISGTTEVRFPKRLALEIKDAGSSKRYTSLRIMSGKEW